MKILLLLTTMSLMGCSLISPPAYDNNEYYFFAELETHARFLIDECDTPIKAKARLETMLFRSETLQTYSYFLPHNTEMYGTSKIINKQLHEISVRYNAEKPPSVVYCKLKSKTLIKEIRRILIASGHLE